MVSGERLRLCAVASNELAYNPRLVKALSYLEEKGWSGSAVFCRTDPRLVGVADQVYAVHPWELGIVKATDDSLRGTIRHYSGAVLQGTAGVLSRRRLWPARAADHALKRYDSAMRRLLKRTRADIYLCNLPENLRACMWWAQRVGAAVWYDSQEYFRGQGDYSLWQHRAIASIEDRWIRQCSVVTAASVPIAAELRKLYANLQVRVIHNVPRMVAIVKREESTQATAPLQVYWRGAAPSLRGRGIENVLRALRLMKSPFVFTVQGDTRALARDEIVAFAGSLGIADRVVFKQSARPDRLVEAGLAYDVGCAVEPGVDENQHLTSSNKVFEYMMAGLAVVASDLPGLRYVVDRCGCGLLVDPTDPAGLASVLDGLADDRGRLRSLKLAARVSAMAEFNFEREMDALLPVLVTAADRPRRRAEE